MQLTIMLAQGRGERAAGRPGRSLQTSQSAEIAGSKYGSLLNQVKDFKA